MEGEKDEDVVERLAREFLNGMAEEKRGEEELPKKEPLYPPSFKGELSEEPTPVMPEGEKPSSFGFEVPEEEPLYSPPIPPEEKIPPERPSDEKIEEILAKLEEEEKGISPKEPVKIEEEEEEEVFSETEGTSDEEILVKRPKKRKVDLRFIKFAIFGCIIGGIIGGGIYFGKKYYKPIINLVQVNVNRVFKPSCDLIVSSNPGAADLFIDDIVKGKTPITIKRLPSGDHNLRIEKEGFKPFISVISVVSRKPINVSANLEPLEIQPEISTKTPTEILTGTGTLIVKTDPVGAIVYIDGQRLKIPCTILSGTHSVRIERPDFLKWGKIIEIKKGETKEVFVKLTPCSGSILIDSNPRNSNVLFNGSLKGKTPIILTNISPWKGFKITITKKGYYNWNATTFVEPRERTKIMAYLKKEEAFIEETKLPKESFYREKPFIPKEKSRFVPEVSIAETSPSILDLKRAIDMFNREVKIETPVIPQSKEEPLVLKREFPEIKKEVPKPQITGGPGYCFITSIPPGADVFLDGRFIGKTPIREFTIPSGKHRLKASFPGYKEGEKEIIVSPDVLNFFNFSLSK